MNKTYQAGTIKLTVNAPVNIGTMGSNIASMNALVDIANKLSDYGIASPMQLGLVEKVAGGEIPVDMGKTSPAEDGRQTIHFWIPVIFTPEDRDRLHEETEIRIGDFETPPREKEKLSLPPEKKLIVAK